MKNLTHKGLLILAGTLISGPLLGVSQLHIINKSDWKVKVTYKDKDADATKDLEAKKPDEMINIGDLTNITKLTMQGQSSIGWAGKSTTYPTENILSRVKKSKFVKEGKDFILIINHIGRVNVGDWKVSKQWISPTKVATEEPVLLVKNSSDWTVEVKYTEKGKSSSIRIGAKKLSAIAIGKAKDIEKITMQGKGGVAGFLRDSSTYDPTDIVKKIATLAKKGSDVLIEIEHVGRLNATDWRAKSIIINPAKHRIITKLKGGRLKKR